MEKVKITPEQAKEIEEISEGSQPFIVSYHAKGILAWEHLSELSLDELIRALYIGYEVEPEFKVGDWVVWDEIKIIGQLVEIDSVLRVDSIDYDVPQSVKLDELRHATPSEIAEEKERRWWAKHGRNLWELRKGDLLIDKHFGKIAEVREVEDKHYLIGAITSYEPLDFIKRNYTVVCFAEQRLDRDGD